VDYLEPVIRREHLVTVPSPPGARIYARRNPR